MRFPSVFLIPATLVLALAGCGGHADEPAVATAVSAGAPATSASAAAGPVAQYVDAQRAWVKCLREAGLDVPDPDAKGRVSFGSTGLRTPAFLAAQDRCKDLVTAVPDGVEEKPASSPEDIQRGRDYAACIRANGVPGFADPGPDGGTTQQQSPSEVVLHAQQICAPVLDGGKPDPHATGAAAG